MPETSQLDGEGVGLTPCWHRALRPLCHAVRTGVLPRGKDARAESSRGFRREESRDAACSGRPQRRGGQRRTPGPDPARTIGAASHRAALSGSASLACCFGVSGCPASALPGAPPHCISGSAGAWLADAQVARLKPRGVRGSPCGRPSCSTQTCFFLPRVHFSFGDLSGESFKGLCVGGEMPCSFGRPVWSCRL